MSTVTFPPPTRSFGFIIQYEKCKGLLNAIAVNGSWFKISKTFTKFLEIPKIKENLCTKKYSSGLVCMHWTWKVNWRQIDFHVNGCLTHMPCVYFSASHRTRWDMRLPSSFGLSGKSACLIGIASVTAPLVTQNHSTLRYRLRSSYITITVDCFPKYFFDAPHVSF